MYWDYHHSHWTIKSSASNHEVQVLFWRLKRIFNYQSSLGLQLWWWRKYSDGQFILYFGYPEKSVNLNSYKGFSCSVTWCYQFLTSIVVCRCTTPRRSGERSRRRARTVRTRKSANCTMTATMMTIMTTSSNTARSSLTDTR